jgi:hypothetical protein
MKQIRKAKRHRGSAGGRREPLGADPRDPDIVHAHRITCRAAILVPAGCRPAATTPPRRSPGGSRLWSAPWSC